LEQLELLISYNLIIISDILEVKEEQAIGRFTWFTYRESFRYQRSGHVTEKEERERCGNYRYSSRLLVIEVFDKNE